MPVKMISSWQTIQTGLSGVAELIFRITSMSRSRRRVCWPRATFRAGAAIVGTCLLLSALATAGRAAEPDTKRVLLLGQGADSHPPGTHEYLAGMRILAKCLRDIPGLRVDVIRADGPWAEGPALIREADCVVLFLAEGAKWIHEDPRRLEAFAQLAARGGGLVVLHWGMGTRTEQFIAGFLRLFGGCHGGDDRKYKVVEAEVQVVDANHDIVRGIAPFALQDEFYYQLKLIDAQGVQPILQTTIDGKLETVAWAWQRADGGRAFGFSGGHFHRNWSRVEYRRLMSQAVLWTLKLAVPKDGLPVEIAADDLALPATP